MTAASASPVTDPEASFGSMAAPGIADKVRAQLLGDYPPSALSWIGQLRWTGPVQVPVSQVDRNTGDTDWKAAAKDKAKLALFQHKIAGGFRKPVVLVRTPGGGKLFAVDGHTRILACTALGVPVAAWVGTAASEHGPWEQAHSRQLDNAGDAPAVDLSAQTAALEVTPAPYGRPDGPGLYGVKGQKHSDYFEQIVRAMMLRGKTKAEASAMAWGILRRWAAGGGKVHPEVRAAAAAALAEEAAKSGHSLANDRSRVIDLVGGKPPYQWRHGWIRIGASEPDHHIAEARKAADEGRHADAINHLTAAIGKTGDKSAAFHLTELRSEMAARQMGKSYKPKARPASLHAMEGSTPRSGARPSREALASMSPAEKRAYVRDGTLPDRLKAGGAPAAPAPAPAAVRTARAPAGSRPVKATSARVPAPRPAPVKRANLRAAIAGPTNADVSREVAPLFDGKYGGFTAKVDSAVRHHGSVHVEGEIFDSQGNYVGLFEREINPGLHGLEVHNTLLQLDARHQGQGFASEFYRRTEANLKASGVHEASVRADIDVGGYAWARKGFDWQTPETGQHMIRQFATRYMNSGSRTPAADREVALLLERAKNPRSRDFPTPYDLSRVGWAPGAAMWPGKKFMLGSDWNGRKIL